MRKRIPIITAAVLAILICVGVRAAGDTEKNLRVVPQPKKVQWRTGGFRLTRDVVIVPGDPDRKDDLFAVGQLADEMERALSFRPRVSDRIVTGKSIVVGLASDPAVAALAATHGIDPQEVTAPEGYVLSIGGNGIVLAGTDGSGTFYAVQTMRQMLRAARDGDLVPAVRIDDWPSFPFRGITDDISRGPAPTMDTIKQTIRRLSELKINKFNFYIEHVFEYRKHPLIGPEGGSLTADQLREIDGYAKQYHIELIGGLQSFGHFYHILKHAKYSQLAENPLQPWVLTPARKESYELLADMYAEIAPPVSSELFNISCDETWGLGEGQAKKMVEEKGIEWVYAYHIRKVHEMLTGHGKRVMMWADIALKHPGILEMLPRDLIFLPWGYGPRDNFDSMLAPVADTGHDFIVCPGANCWGRMFPNIYNARINIGNFARDGMKYRAWGVLNTTWDDDGENLFGYNWYPVAWGAEAGWNPLEADHDRFAAAFSQAFYGAGDDSFSRAVEQFEKAAQVIDLNDLRDSYYWEWPPVTRHASVQMAEVDAAQCAKYMKKAEALLLEARRQATVNSENIDYPLFAALRILDMCDRRINFIKAARLYEKIADRAAREPERVLPALEHIDSVLAQTQQGVKDIWTEYSRLWLLENRPYWLDVNEKKYTELESGIGAVRDRLREAVSKFDSNGTLPPAADIGLYMKTALDK